MRLILASASPRRAAILTEAGIAFDIEPAHIDETRREGEGPVAYVCRLAAEKAAAIAGRHGDRPVLAADSVVVVGGTLFGKPVDEEDARAMLHALSGRTHEVLTGVTLQLGPRIQSEVVCTHVTFTPLTIDQLDWYVTSGEPFDKAGAYAIQGLASRFVERIEGSYANVVGLPVQTVIRLIAEATGESGWWCGLPAGGEGRYSGH